MRTILRAGIVLILLSAGGALRAQPGDGPGLGPGSGLGGGQLFLLGQKSVRTELKLTEEQTKELDQRSAEMRGAMSGLREKSREERRKIFEEQSAASEATLQKVLAKEQLQRLKEISWQQAGGRALRDEEVATALGLSEEQTKRVDEITAAAREEMRGQFGGGGNRAEARAKFEQLRKTTDEKLLAVLSAEQHAKLKELVGAPFTGEIERPMFRGGRQPGA